MSELLPRPVPGSLSLVVALAGAPDVSPLGVWLRARRPVAVVARVRSARAASAAVERSDASRLLLIDGNLGRLLDRCPVIVIRLGSRVAAVGADHLIRARALRVVAGLPYPPTLRAFRRLFPDALATPAGVDVPLSHRSAEEVLAAFATARAPVLFSRVVYRTLDRTLGAPRGGWGQPVDSAPGGRLG